MAATPGHQKTNVPLATDVPRAPCPNFDVFMAFIATRWPKQLQA
jgi:hypothetical protein